jgi:hypothetical protein
MFVSFRPVAQPGKFAETFDREDERATSGPDMRVAAEQEQQPEGG